MVSNPVLIGDFLHRIKRPLKIESTSRYKLVTVKLKHKGVVLREEKFGAEIKSNMYQVKAGDFILSGIDARMVRSALCRQNWMALLLPMISGILKLMMR